MKLGIFDHMQKNDKPERSYADMYANHLEVLELADQTGMDFYFVAEHHFDLGFSECPSPGTFLGAASQRTKRIRLGPLVYVLPLWNPIRVAEEVALLDNLTQGRLECGFGAGIGPFSFAAYNIPWEQKREMTLEALRIIKGIWTHESFTFEGRYFKCKDIDSSIPLVQKPHPPLWMPTRSNGAHGSTGLSTILDGSRRQELMDMEHSIAEGSFICGSPETVVGQIKKIANEAGADTFLGEFTFGELTQKQSLNSLRLFTEQVMPELRKFDIDALNFPKAEA